MCVDLVELRQARRCMSVHQHPPSPHACWAVGTIRIAGCGCGAGQRGKPTGSTNGRGANWSWNCPERIPSLLSRQNSYTKKKDGGFKEEIICGLNWRYKRKNRVNKSVVTDGSRKRTAYRTGRKGGDSTKNLVTLFCSFWTTKYSVFWRHVVISMFWRTTLYYRSHFFHLKWQFKTTEHALTKFLDRRLEI